MKIGKYKCDACKGLGYLFVSYNRNFFQKSWAVGKCSVCNGSGEVDWVTHINSPDDRFVRKIKTLEKLRIVSNFTIAGINKTSYRYLKIRYGDFYEGFVK